MRLFLCIIGVCLLASASEARKRKKQQPVYDDDYEEYYDDQEDVVRRDGGGGHGGGGHSGGYSSGGGDAGGGGGGGLPVDLLAPLVLLAPVAGLLSLFGAAAINSNSALITLAVLNTGRKKRSASVRETEAEQEVDVLANFLFNGQHQNLVSTSQRDQIISKYVSCSSPQETECLQFLACTAFSSAAETAWPVADGEGARLIMRELIKNPLVDPRFKKGLTDAVRLGKTTDCAARYRCKM